MDGSLIRKDPRNLVDVFLLCPMRFRHRGSAVLNSKNMDGLLLLLARILFEASTVASQHTTSRDDANTKAKKPKIQTSGTGNAMTDVALVVSVLATLICVVQVVQQYAVSGSPMRLCDSIVYGGSRGLPGRGRRRWVLSQFRYRIIYEMPRISLAPLNPRLGIFVPYLIKPSPSFDWPAPNHKLMSRLRKFDVRRTTGEAAWVSFSRLLNQVCPGSVIVNGVKGDADRCPLDMTVIPMPVSMRDMAFFALSVGMDCIDASFSSPSMTMSGPSGTITSSQHSLLGPILHYAPPQDGFELEKLGVKMDSAWILRVCGRIRVGNTMLYVGTDTVDVSHEEMSQQLLHENDITVNEASAKSLSEDTMGSENTLDSWSTFEEEIKHLKHTNRHEGKCCTLCEYKDDRKCHHLCCNQCSANCGRQSPKKVAFKVDEKAKHSWSHRNYVLSTTKIGQLNWYWLSQIPVTPGFWVTPFKSHVKVDVCWGAQATILQALYEMLARDTLLGVEQARKYTLDTIEMFCGFNHLSFPPYGSTRYGEPMSPDLIKEFAKRFEFVESLTFDSHIPLLQMHKGSRSPAAHGVLDNHRLWTIDVMSLDVWLNIAAKKEAIYAGMALIVKCVPSIVSEIMNTMGDDFAKVSCDGSHTVLSNAVAKLEEAVQTAGIACSRVELSHAEHMYVLVALLRTAKVGLCIGLGHDSTPLLKIIEKDVQAHLL